MDSEFGDAPFVTGVPFPVSDASSGHGLSSLSMDEDIFDLEPRHQYPSQPPQPQQQQPQQPPQQQPQQQQQRQPQPQQRQQQQQKKHQPQRPSSASSGKGKNKAREQELLVNLFGELQGHPCRYASRCTVKDCRNFHGAAEARRNPFVVFYWPVLCPAEERAPQVR